MAWRMSWDSHDNCNLWVCWSCKLCILHGENSADKYLKWTDLKSHWHVFRLRKKHPKSGKKRSVGGISCGLWRSLPGTGLYWQNSSKHFLARHAMDKLDGIGKNGPLLENNEQLSSNRGHSWQVQQTWDCFIHSQTRYYIFQNRLLTPLSRQFCPKMDGSLSSVRAVFVGYPFSKKRKNTQRNSWQFHSATIPARKNCELVVLTCSCANAPSWSIRWDSKEWYTAW